mmetsp:Transcript_15643/g.38764  ORF Transcript_15643/g.38764 Transcript_15643/m.38764 type:complete len:206 (-) Transcript_15643:553-1170(-)
MVSSSRLKSAGPSSPPAASSRQAAYGFSLVIFLHSIVYISIKWCCVVAFSKISRVRYSSCEYLYNPSWQSSAYSLSNFSNVSLFKIDFVLRSISASLSVAALNSACCFFQLFSPDSSKGGAGPRCHWSPVLFGLPPLLDFRGGSASRWPRAQVSPGAVVLTRASFEIAAGRFTPGGRTRQLALFWNCFMNLSAYTRSLGGAFVFL